jgi:leucyl-tRNA synthetase
MKAIRTGATGRLMAHYWQAHPLPRGVLPAFLMSAGIPVQSSCPWLSVQQGEKMSKSVGNVVDPFNLANQYGAIRCAISSSRGAVRAGRQL